MFDILGDTSRGTAVVIAKTICSKYPDTFADLIDKINLGAGWESLSAHIYTAINYRKAKERTKRPRALGALYSDNDDDDENARPLPQTTPRKQDEYGCVDYQPLLPEGETPSSQETKRKRLITLYQTSPDIFEGEVKQLMNDTYPTQRGVINDCSRGSGLTQSVFQKWPFLNNDKVLVAHAQQLLGIEVNEIWRRNLRKVTKIRNFFKYEYVTKIFIAKKKGIELPDPFVKNTIKEEKRQSQNDTRSELSLTLVIFPLIVYYFEEDRDFLFIIVENTLTIEEIIGKVPNAAPTLIIRGTSLYDETASCSVLLEKAFEIKVGNILDGFLLTFLCYFIFGCKYPKELQCTLEFIQRFIILINPPEGSKRKCKKRKQTSYNPKVLKLINILNEALSAITL
ncbi:uncharacterized protein LOC107045011 [Diachasma alloeum]|uniref:uncharacterized protein LOC107045011 n=1 Tax=Diachasma alloeum TaxID=454923 RepID=UPI0007382CF9|nr:uncharacterized protein LOC107045011 [Diachasma alloeum]